MERYGRIRFPNLDGVRGPPLHFQLQHLLIMGGEGRKYAKEWIKSHPGAMHGYHGDWVHHTYPDGDIDLKFKLPS